MKYNQTLTLTPLNTPPDICAHLLVLLHERTCFKVNLVSWQIKSNICSVIIHPAELRKTLFYSSDGDETLSVIVGGTATVSGSQGCADISIQIQRSVLVSVNQPGTSVLLSLPTILKRTAHKVIRARDWTWAQARENRVFFNCTATTGSITQCVFKKKKKKGKKWKKKMDFAELYDPSERNIDL